MLSVKYPFEFNVCLLTNTILDKLEFSEYWAGSGDFGERWFGKKMQGDKYGRYETDPFIIVEYDDNQWPSGGYVTPEYYCPNYYGTPFNDRPLPEGVRGEIYFFHELYESMARHRPQLIDLLIERSKPLNLYPYITDWLDYKNKIAQKESLPLPTGGTT